MKYYYLSLMTVNEIKESWWMYALGILVTIFIVGGSLYFGLTAYKKGKELNMSKDMMKKTIISSVSFSILPSIGIFIGVITMAGLLGIPLPWIRLSVIGALHYELMALSIAAEGVTLATMTVENFVTIAFVMTISITWGAIFALLFFKKYQQKVINKATKDGGKGFGKILFDAFFIGMISAYIGDAVAKMVHYEVKIIENGSYLLDGSGNPITEDRSTVVPIIVMASAMMAMAFCEWLITKKKVKWLENFALSFSMIFGMTVAVLLGLGGIY